MHINWNIVIPIWVKQYHDIIFLPNRPSLVLIQPIKNCIMNSEMCIKTVVVQNMSVGPGDSSPRTLIKKSLKLTITKQVFLFQTIVQVLGPIVTAY